MTVLVTAASKHSATSEIAIAIKRGLQDRGVSAVFMAPQDVARLDDFEAVVLGSAIYAGHWMEPATTFVDKLMPQLRARPVWLFSCGPVGDSPKPATESADTARIAKSTQAREHRLFSGRLDRSQLGVAERAVVKLVRAKEGDFRNWDAVDDFTAGIARSLRTAGAVQ